MNKLYFSFCLFFFVNNTYSQISTFNKTYNFGYPAAVILRLIATDSCVYATGIVVDSLPPYNSLSLFLKLDFEGNVLIQKALNTPIEKTYETWGDFIAASDGSLLATGYTYDTETTVDRIKTLLIKYSSSGDTLLTNEYISPFHDFYYNGTIMEINDTSYLLCNSAYNPISTNNEIVLLKVNNLGNEIWTSIIFEDKNIPPGYMRIYDSDFYIMGTGKNNREQITPSVEYTGKVGFYIIDSVGDVVDGWFSEDLNLTSVHYFLETADSGYICTSRIGSQINYSMNWDGFVFKIDKNFNIEWSIIYKDTFPELSTSLGKIIELSDGTGYLASGSVFEYLGGVLDTGWNINGWVVKFTGEGDSLWSRYFHYWNTPHDEHYFSDMEEMPDGGILLCGQAYSGNVGTQQQLGWLVKLDEFGCLVPGCQLVAAHQPQQPEVSLLLYPNPATDILNIYTWSPYTPKNALLRIVSSDGQVVRESPVTRSDMTSMIPVRDLAAGVYFVQYVEGGVVVAVEEAVIAR